MQSEKIMGQMKNITEKAVVVGDRVLTDLAENWLIYATFATTAFTLSLIYYANNATGIDSPACRAHNQLTTIGYDEPTSLPTTIDDDGQQHNTYFVVTRGFSPLTSWDDKIKQLSPDGNVEFSYYFGPDQPTPVGPNFPEDGEQAYVAINCGNGRTKIFSTKDFYLHYPDGDYSPER